MLRTFWAALAFAGALLVAALPAFSYPENYLSAKMGASVSTHAKLQDGHDARDIMSDGPVSKGTFTFADVPQRQMFTIDFGQERTFDRVNFSTDNAGGPRNPNSLVIEVSSESVDGPYQKVFEKNEFGWMQVLRLPLITARWVRFDFGEGFQGVTVSRVRIYKGYEHPKLVEVTRLLHERIRPGLPGLEKFYSAADAGEWPKACSELRAYFAGKLEREERNPDYDLSRAAGYYEGTLDFAGITRIENVPIDWGYQKTTDWYEHLNFLNRGAPIGVSIDAYYHTHNKKWADHWRTIFYDWIDANPKPETTAAGDYPTWRTLDSAARNGWLRTRFPKVTHTPEWEDELWANLLYSIWEHADYGKNDNFTGGNWLAINSGSIMAIALDFPEFKDEPRWLEFGRISFETNVMRDVHPDGKETEDAPGYVAFAYSGMLGTLMCLDKAGVAVTPEARARLEKIQEFLAAVTQPNGKTPAIGDSGGGDAYSLPSAFEYFKRDDIRYVWTKGKEGVPPSFTSILFPQGNWCIMRSDYDEQDWESARHLVMKASSGSHGHRDELMITAYAYGRELLIDAGIRSYEGADVAYYLPTPIHNTVCVDGQSRGRFGGNIDKWATNDGVDYALGNQDPAYRGLAHRRDIVFVKPEYWVLHDDVQGEGEHTYAQNWHFAEDAAISGDPATKVVRTNYAADGNLLMIPVDTRGLDSQIKDFLIARERKTGAQGVDSKGWTYTKTGPAPQVFDLVLYPYAGANAPNVTVRPLAIGGASAVDVTALEVTVGDKTDYVLISRTGPRRFSIASKKLFAYGELVVLRTVGGKPVRVSGTNVNSVTFKGKALFNTVKTVEEMDRILTSWSR